MRENIFSKTWYLIKTSALGFVGNGDTKYGASLSFYTIFSLPPLLIIIISLSGVFFGPDAVRGELYGQISHLVGQSAAVQIQEMLKNVALSHDSVFATTIGIVSLIFGASGVFSEIQDSINIIWGIKPKPNRSLKTYIRNRLISFSMIVAVGFLLLVSLLINALVDIFSHQLERYLPGISGITFTIIDYVLLMTIISTLFMIIFKTLPDGRVGWKDSIIGALFTAIFFMLGKFGIGAYLGSSKITTIYGTAGSVILILLWVYYSSLILYFGAEFTKVYAFKYGTKIIPNRYSVFIKLKEVELKEGNERPKKDLKAAELKKPETDKKEIKKEQ